MTPSDAELALNLLRQVLGKFTDAKPEQIVPEAELASLQIDSLTLAEMLFELEDRVGVSMTEPSEPPRTVADILGLMEPYLEQLRAKAAEA